MKSYFLTLFGAGLFLSAIALFIPQGEGEGISKRMKTLSGLFFALILLSPLPGVFRELSDWVRKGDYPELIPNVSEEFQIQMDTVAREYTADTLTQNLENKFSVPAGEIRCVLFWNEKGDGLEKVRVVLSGSSIWKDPEEIEEYVRELLNCPCDSAIE